MKLEIVTPVEKVYEGEATGVKMPGVLGSFEVLDNHAAFVSNLEAGKIRIHTGGDTKHYQITGGVVEVLKNTVTVLAESAEEVK